MSILGNVFSAVFWGLLLLSILVFVHEGGHYLVARFFGARVTEFFLGLPCRFKLSWKSKKVGTEFGVTPFLLGGYNRICGMEDYVDELNPKVLEIVQREGRVEARAIADELGIELERTYNILVGLSDLAAIKPYYDPEKGESPNQRDYPDSFQTVARDANMLTEYDKGHDFEGLPFTGEGEPRPVENAKELYDNEVNHTYLGMSIPKRLLTLLAGPFVNLLLAFILVTGTYLTTEYVTPVPGNVLESVESGSAAEAAGLMAGDSILKIADQETPTWSYVINEINSRVTAGEDFDITYARDGVEQVAHVTPSEANRESGKIGISVKTEPYHLSLLEACRGAIGYAKTVATFALKLIMPQHTMEVLGQSSSIVGISVMASEAAASGMRDLIAFMAAISMSLGFMNLLPIPPLDGGKIIIELIQGAIRRPLSMKARMAVSYVGLAFFLFVFFVVVRNDVIRYMM